MAKQPEDPKSNAPAPRPPLATATQDTEKRDKNAAPQFSSTAVAEELPPQRPGAPNEKAQEAARKKVEPLQKEYESTLEEIQQTADPAKRAQLVHRKGNITRQIDAIKRPARLA